MMGSSSCQFEEKKGNISCIMKCQAASFVTNFSIRRLLLVYRINGAPSFVVLVSVTLCELGVNSVR
uniref:Uncharacterized protein n=1 Tax=Arundo donax TaxID=35708 RepID=A0A0A9CQJ9_ARUDO